MIHDNKAARYCGRKTSLWLIALLLLAACGEQRFEAKEAHQFSLPLLQGTGEVSLADYRGQVVYISFWASWCEPCRQEMPYLAQLWQRHHPQGFQVLAINGEEDKVLAQEFAAGYELPFPLLRDEQRQVSLLYRVPGYPTHYIIDRRGRIRFSGLGFNLADVGAISQEIETLLAESGDVTN